MAYSRALLALAQRHVQDGERRVAAQEELIERLKIGGHSTEGAEELLLEMRNLLEFMRRHLEEIERDVERPQTEPSWS